jgi:hypothetical protein
MKNVWDGGGVAACILNLGSGWTSVVGFTSGHFTAREEPTLHVGQEAGRVPEPVWTLWRKEIFDFAGNRTPLSQTLTM